MFPSSKRVRLNRVALKDVVGLQLVPRGKRDPRPLKPVTNDPNKQEDKHVVSEIVSVKDTSINEPLQTFLTEQMAPESVTDTAGKSPAEKKCQASSLQPKRRNDFQSCKRKDTEIKQEGPFTRGKYRQSKPNTRSKSSLGRRRFAWCHCVCSESVEVKRTEVRCRVEPRGNITKTQVPLSGGKATNNPTKLKYGAGKPSGRRCKLKRGNIKGKSRLIQVARSRRERQSRVKAMVKARSAGCEPQPAGQVRTGTPTGLSASGDSNEPITAWRSLDKQHKDIDQNVLPCLTGLAGSEGSLRRTVRASGCGFCGDCKYISPQQKTLGKQRQKSSSPGALPPMVTVNPKKIIVWLDRYPKVTLCDISQNCNISSQDSVIVLPDVLKRKVVHCFKRDMRTGFQFRPSGLGHNKLGSDEPALAKNSGLCPRVQSERSICQPQSLTENRKHLKEHTDAETLSGHTSRGRASEAPATCSASFSPGKRTNKRECRTGMYDRYVKENLGPGCDFLGEEMHGDKRVKLGDSIEDGSLPFTSDFESISCNDPAKARDEVSDMSSERFCQRTELDTDEIESLTCQRVRVYCRKTKFSCARTCISWPFSNSVRTLTAHAGTTACPAVSIDPSTRDNSHSPINQNQPGSPSNRTNVMLPNAATDSSTNQVSHRNEKKGDDGARHGREEDGERGEGHGNRSSHSFAGKNVEFVPLFREESLASPPSDIATLSTSNHQRKPGTETVSASSLPANGPETDSSMSDPCPSALGLNDWQTATLSPMSSPFPHGCLSSLSVIPSSLQPSSFLVNKVKGVELPDAHSTCASPTSFSSSPKYIVKTIKDPLFCCKEMSSCSSSSNSPPHNSDSFHSCDAFLLLPQENQEGNGDILTSRSPPKLEPYYNSSPCNYDVVGKKRSLHNVPTKQCLETDSNVLPPLLSPVNSPQWHSRTSFLPQRSCSSDEEEEGEEMSKDINRQKLFHVHHMPKIVSGNSESCKNDSELCVEFKGVSPDFKSLSDDTPRELQSFPTSDEDVDEGNVEESLDETDLEDDEAHDTQLLSATEEGSSPSEIAGSERHTTKSEAAGDTQSCILNEFTAYEQDILLVDVIQDDPELFDNLPQKSVLKLGPTRVSEAPKTRPTGVSEQRLTPVNVDFHFHSLDIKEERVSRPWRPKCSRTPFEMQSDTWPTTYEQTKTMGQSNANNNLVNGGPERNQPIQTVKAKLNHIPPLITNGPWIKTQANKTEFRHQKSNTYCRHYFSESLSCMFKMCRFLHVPVEGDEKFCVETVTRFLKTPMCLQRAGAVFTGYYQSNPPGVYFSMPVLLSLLWALLKAGMVSDVFSVLSVSLPHKRVPDHEFLLALFNYIREKGLMGCVPELMQLTVKMASAGLMLSLDCFDGVKNSPEFQQMVHPYSPVPGSDNHKLSVSTGAPFPEYLNFVHVIVEIELCTKQEDWRRMGKVFKSFCQSCQHPNQVERISGHIAIALLSESKDKLSLPFTYFAETVCQGEDEDSVIRSFLGRIGVALMLRYHKTHQWAKGQRVVKVLSFSKVNYSMLKGLFGNEDGASRCHLVTVATELFLLSGSVEGALNTLRENEWFLSSCSWPCEPVDLESRSCVLMHLAERTSHRDTLEILCNLPGIKEPNDLVDISKFSARFNSHLQVCMDRQIFPVASDTVDFMLGKNLAVDHAKLQILLHKLGKQNMWLRAREVFRRSLSVGYYAGVSAPPGFKALIVPSGLGEIELALAFEMFITVNATGIVHLTETTTSCLSITLKRTDSCESEYLSAGSRLLSAACIPQPKLIVHYTAVNSSQEQVFALDISSAQRWLRHNHLWANEVWTH